MRPSTASSSAPKTRISGAWWPRGYSPRLILLALGNVSNDAVLAALLAAADRLEQVFADPTTGIVEIE